MKSLFYFLGATAIASASEKTIITFDGAEGTSFNWYTSDDPVMGGSSKSAWQLENSRGSWAGEVKIVSFLGAPGFCSVGTSGYSGDWSSAGVDGSVVLKLRINPRNFAKSSAQTLTYFAVQFYSSNKEGYRKGEFACPMTVDLKAPWGKSHTIKVPFKSCSQSWRGQSEGGPPTLRDLSAISRIRLSTGKFTNGHETGYAGHFDLEFERISIQSASASKQSASHASKSIVELASGDKDLSTLVAALTAGKLVTALEGKGPFTVFAPTNEAFAKLPKATLHSLLEPKNIKLLDAVLEYHVVAGAAVYSKDLKASQHVKTLEGQQLLVTKGWNGVHINGKAKVTTADVGATNGVVHIIDTVLVPGKGCTIKVPTTLQPAYAFEFAALDKDNNGYISTSEFKGMGVKLIENFDSYRKKGNTWGHSWGGRRLRGSWLEALQRKMKERADAMRASRVFKKFDENQSHYISLCEFENAMYKETLEDGGNNNDGPVLVHG